MTGNAPLLIEQRKHFISTHITSTTDNYATKILSTKFSTHETFDNLCLVLHLEWNTYQKKLFVFQKERMESMEKIKQNMSVLIKSDENDVELSFWRRLKLRFSSRLQRKHEREIACADLLKEAFENLDEAWSYVAQMKNKI